VAVHQLSKTRVPSFVGAFNPIARRLLGVGIPLGPNALLTVAGRKSGQPRTTPVALIEIGGKRWVVGTFGETHWVQNLRAAGAATITVGGTAEQVNARELSTEEGADFFADVLVPYIRKVPLGRWMIGSVLGARDILDDPHGAGASHPVFELHSRPET
jgi:deazaflavin-dependent oxidoreductase (nitroreductase family)